MSWTEQGERSNRFWVALIVAIARLGGRHVVRLLLYPIAAYFCATGAPARRASRDFLSRALDRPVAWSDVLRHVYTFARVLADRLFMLTDGFSHFRIQTQGEQVFAQQMRPGRGCLLLVSHLGSFDALRVLGARDQRLPLRIVLDRRRTPMVGELLNQLDPELAAGIIDASLPSPQLVLEIDEALRQGALVGVMADRCAPAERRVGAAFLGRQAGFPAGPWTLAMVLKVPVVLCFGLYDGGDRYRVYFELVTPGLDVPRRGREAALRGCVQHYADRLAHYARMAPYNWFNFYDFWADESATHH